MLAAAALCAGLGMAPTRAIAETGKPPLVDQVAGNCYERRVWDENDVLDTRQRIFVHDWEEGPEGAHARIDVVRLTTPEEGDGELRVKERFNFRIVGEMVGDAQEEAALQIIGHLGGNKRIALDFLGNAAIYPQNGCRGQELPPVEFDVKVEGGLVDLLGGRAEIRIVDRTCSVPDLADDRIDGYLIRSELRMKTYLIGIRFLKRRYESQQLVESGQGLVRYVLQDPDGKRQEIALVDHASCSPPWIPAGD